LPARIRKRSGWLRNPGRPPRRLTAHGPLATPGSAVASLSMQLTTLACPADRFRHQRRVTRPATLAPAALSSTSSTEDTRPSASVCRSVSTASEPAAGRPMMTGRRASDRNRSGASAPNAANNSRFPPAWATATAGAPASWAARSRGGRRCTSRGVSRGTQIIHSHGTVPTIMPTSATLCRYASAEAAPWLSATGPTPPPPRRHRHHRDAHQYQITRSIRATRTGRRVAAARPPGRPDRPRGVDLTLHALYRGRQGRRRVGRRGCRHRLTRRSGHRRGNSGQVPHRCHLSPHA
jgi:hypothetical protein